MNKYLLLVLFLYTGLLLSNSDAQLNHISSEAQGVEDYAWEGVLACVTGSDDRVLAVGNPLEPSGRFFHASRAPGWRSIRISAFEHPNVLSVQEG